MARGVTVKPTGCGFDPHSRRWNIYLNLCFHFFALVSRLRAALSSATQHAMPPEIGRKWGTECLNTRFLLPTLLCAGYSVKLIFDFFQSVAFNSRPFFDVPQPWLSSIPILSFSRLSFSNHNTLANPRVPSIDHVLHTCPEYATLRYLTVCKSLRFWSTWRSNFVIRYFINPRHPHCYAYAHISKAFICFLRSSLMVHDSHQYTVMGLTSFWSRRTHREILNFISGMLGDIELKFKAYFQIYGPMIF